MSTAEKPTPVPDTRRRERSTTPGSAGLGPSAPRPRNPSNDRRAERAADLRKMMKAFLFEHGIQAHLQEITNTYRGRGWMIQINDPVVHASYPKVTISTISQKELEKVVGALNSGKLTVKFLEEASDPSHGTPGVDLRGDAVRISSNPSKNGSDTSGSTTTTTTTTDSTEAIIKLQIPKSSIPIIYNLEKENKELRLENEKLRREVKGGDELCVAQEEIRGLKQDIMRLQDENEKLREENKRAKDKLTSGNWNDVVAFVEEMRTSIEPTT